MPYEYEPRERAHLQIWAKVDDSCFLGFLTFDYAVTRYNEGFLSGRGVFWGSVGWLTAGCLD